MTQADETIKARIIEAFELGKLLEAIFDQSNLGDRSASFAAACAELHNEGKIDVLSAIQSPAFAGISGPRFFTGQHVYCQIIPKLSAPVIEVMHCVAALVNKGGPDWPAPGSEDTELGVLMEPEVSHGETEVYPGV